MTDPAPVVIQKQLTAAALGAGRSDQRQHGNTTVQWVVTVQARDSGDAAASPLPASLCQCRPVNTVRLVSAEGLDE